MKNTKEEYPISREFSKRIGLRWVAWGICVASFVILSVSFAFGDWVDKCSAGLILSMFGVCITFKFALPEPENVTCDSRGLEKGTDCTDEGEKIKEGEKENRIEKRKILRKMWAWLGWGYLMVGLGFQLWYQVGCWRR